METQQTFPNQAAKDAALLELSEKRTDLRIAYLEIIGAELNETAVMAHVHGWRSSRVEEGKIRRDEIENVDSEYTRLKSVPVEPVKSAEEVLCEFICLEYYELAERSDQHIMTPNEALKAMHQFAAQSVGIPTEEDIKKAENEFYFNDNGSAESNWRNGVEWLRNKLTTK